MELKENNVVIGSQSGVMWLRRTPKRIDAVNDQDFRIVPPTPIDWDNDENWDSDDEKKSAIALVDDLADQLTKAIGSNKVIINHSIRNRWIQRLDDVSVNRRICRNGDSEKMDLRKQWRRSRMTASRNTPY